jgi:hypothetical protein
MKENEIKQEQNCGCPYCEGSDANETPIFCQPCAVKTLACPSCGKPVPKTRKTCPNCGASMRQKTATK